MELYINTTENHLIILKLSKKGEVILEKKISAEYSQAEKLLPEIDKLLKKAKVNLKDLKRIVVANQGGSFTSLRIGILTANALGYALGISVEPENEKAKKGIKTMKIVTPIYDGEPNISISKKKLQ